MCVYEYSVMDINNLPDDKDTLKDIVADYHQQLIYLQEKLNYLQKAIYGSKSDKKPKCGSKETWPMMPGLVEMETEVESPQEKTITIPEHSRKKRGRKPIPKDLPRKDIIHDLCDEEKICLCGVELSVIGQEVSEKLDYSKRPFNPIFFSPSDVLMVSQIPRRDRYTSQITKVHA